MAIKIIVFIPNFITPKMFFSYKFSKLLYLNIYTLLNITYIFLIVQNTDICKAKISYNQFNDYI